QYLRGQGLSLGVLRDRFEMADGQVEILWWLRELLPLRLKPIFVTNIFGHVQSELIPQSDWQFLLQRRPRYGWPLSLPTVLELLAGLDGIRSDKCPNLQAQGKLAFVGVGSKCQTKK